MSGVEHMTEKFETDTETEKSETVETLTAITRRKLKAANQNLALIIIVSNTSYLCSLYPSLAYLSF